MTIERGMFVETPIKGLVVINKPINTDNRGFLQEMFKSSEYKLHGFEYNPLHAALSGSKPNVLRGIHTENWAKLIMPLTGKMFGAYADVRPDSKTFGKVFTMEFDNRDLYAQRKILLIPPGVGNSICVIGNEPVLYMYLNEKEWTPEGARGVLYNDPDLNIGWPIDIPIISERDQNNPTLRQLYPEKFNG